MNMKLGHYKFNLPEELIAQHPVHHRDDARLMVLHRDSGKIEHRHFKDIVDYFTEGDVLVANNAKVFPARLFGNKEKSGAMIEVIMLRELNADNLLWDVLVDPARKIRIGNKIYFGPNDEIVAEVIDNTTSRGRTLRFLFDGSSEEFQKTILSYGETPLPKYIDRPVEPEDIERYQTIFAKHEGAVAAPTAGLHFSRELLKRMELHGINFAEITLFLGLGMFRQVEVEDLTKHKVDSEEAIVTQEAADLVNKSILAKKKVCAVGTSVLRTIESSVSTTKTLNSFNGWTGKFIFPPHDFFIANSLISNFHSPESVPLMTVTAFGGYDLVMKGYKEALKEKYRFLAYGDAMLIL
jgi:S-adenosylmethionine:tRNA ribosyltransferase-isomerase